jgi:excisionase family DNA binding protein
MPETWMSTKQAAKYLNLCVGRVRQILLQGRLKARKSGPKLWEISRSAVVSFGKLKRPRGRPRKSA